MIAIGDRHAAHLADLDAAPRCSIFVILLREADDAVRKGFDLRIPAAVSRSIEQQCDNSALRKESLEPDQLAPEAGRIACQEADF